MPTNRILAFASIIFSTCLLTCATFAGAKDNYLMYVGTYTESGSESKGIYAYRFNSASGTVTSIGLAASTKNPSFLAIDPSHRFLYAVNEIGLYEKQNSGAVTAFAIDHATGKLKQLNEVASGGADPCYIVVDRSGKWVLVANYTGGSVAVFPILPDGKLGARSAFIQHTGHGPNLKRQEAPHAHSIDVSPDNRFALVDDLGLDETLIYKFDSEKGLLTPNVEPFHKADPGVGPRHLAFDPTGHFIAVLNEMASTLTLFSFDPSTGGLQGLQTISTIPKDFTAENTDAEVEFSPSGKFLYASNRGHDSIAIFAVDAERGSLSLVDIVKTKGQSPRNFEIAPGGKLLLAANEKSDDIVVFRIDQKSGRLTPTGKQIELSQPVCVKFVPVD